MPPAYAYAQHSEFTNRTARSSNTRGNSLPSYSADGPRRARRAALARRRAKEPGEYDWASSNKPGPRRPLCGSHRPVMRDRSRRRSRGRRPSAAGCPAGRAIRAIRHVCAPKARIVNQVLCPQNSIEFESGSGGRSAMSVPTATIFPAKDRGSLLLSVRHEAGAIQPVKVWSG